MKKYKQTYIPKLSTEKWKMPSSELRKKVYYEYKKKYIDTKKDTPLKNKDLGIEILFIRKGAEKTAFGGRIYPKKACIIDKLDTILRNAEYSNFGKRKEKDPKNVIGYLNFKCKVVIDSKKEYLRLSVRLTNDGKFHYSHEVNIYKK